MMRFAAILLLLTSVLLTMSGCAHTVTEKGGAYVDAATGISYTYAGFDWMPMDVGDRYATIKTGSTTYPLYTVKELSPEKWLCTEDGDLFYASGVTMPTLETFGADGLLLCRQKSKDTLVSNVDDAETVAAIVDRFLTGPAIFEPAADPIDRLELYLTSSENAGIRYHLILLFYEEPVAFTEDGFDYVTNVLMYSRALNRYVDGGAFFSTYAA